MIPKRIDQITKNDVDALVANEVREGRTIEFKQQLPGGRDDDKKEFLADVSSFANASGGDLIFGIEETRDKNGKPTGIPQSAPGLAGINADQEIQRLENIIRDGVEPRIPGVQTRVIDGFEIGPVIVVRLPRSWASPHMVTFKASPRFFSRTSAGKAPLDVPEIRAAFVQSEALPERIRRFREERIGNIIAGETPIPLQAGACVVLHVVPIEAFHSQASIDVSWLRNNIAALPPLGSSGWSGRINLDGFVTYSGGRNSGKPCDAYTQLFRNASCEAVSGRLLEPMKQDQLWIPSISYEQSVIAFVDAVSKFYKTVDIGFPVVIMLSLLHVKGYFMHVGSRYFSSDPVAIERDNLLIPETVLEEELTSVASALRPMFDMVWQACGYPRSFNYDENGQWQPR